MNGVDRLDPTKTALLLVDLQNDFIHSDGAYARGGATSRAIAELPGRVAPVADAARAASIPVVATLFTLVPGPNGPMISDHLARLRPFLGAGDFAPGSWGQASLDQLGSIDVTVEKVAYSAFHASRLEFVLDRLGVDSLIVAGIVTNGGVASTVRAAHVLDLHTVVLSDGCAAFSDEAHDASVASLATVSGIATCADAAGWLSSL
ncbi:MAG: cysteine hydrolase family protein [Acidimicrobiales bacterium]